MRQDRPQSLARFAFESLLDRTLCMTQFSLSDCAPLDDASDASSRRTLPGRLLEYRCAPTGLRCDARSSLFGSRPRTNSARQRRESIESPLRARNDRRWKDSAGPLVDSIFFAPNEGCRNRCRSANVISDWKAEGTATAASNAATQIWGVDIVTCASLAHCSHVGPLSRRERAFRFTRCILFVRQASQRVHFLSDISQQSAKQRTSGAILSRSPASATLPLFNFPGGLFYRATRILQCRPPTRARPSRARGVLRHRAILAEGRRQLRIL
jgi:hypothetical protein